MRVQAFWIRLVHHCKRDPFCIHSSCVIWFGISRIALNNGIGERVLQTIFTWASGLIDPILRDGCGQWRIDERSTGTAPGFCVEPGKTWAGEKTRKHPMGGRQRVVQPL